MPKCTYAFGGRGWICIHVMKIRTNIHVYMLQQESGFPEDEWDRSKTMGHWHRVHVTWAGGGADEKQMPGCHIKAKCLDPQPAPARWVFGSAATLKRDKPCFLKCSSDFHLGFSGVSHCSESQTFPGKADAAVPVQDQEHEWTVKLLIPESARTMMCSISSSSWKSKDGIKHLGWDGAVPYGSRAKGQVYLADWLAHCLNAPRDIILILINYLSGNKFIKNSIKSHSLLHKSIIKQNKKRRRIPLSLAFGVRVLHRAFKILL